MGSKTTLSSVFSIQGINTSSNPALTRRTGFILLLLLILFKQEVQANDFWLDVNKSQANSTSSTLLGLCDSNYYIDKHVEDKELIVEAMPVNNNEVFQLFSHGRSGELLIKGKWLNKKEIANFLNSEFRIQNSTFSYLNIYGCEFAKGEKGLAAVSYLEKTLGLKVNASTNITGAAGDWLLEVGNVTKKEFKKYSYNLQCPTEPLVQGTRDDEDYDGDGICNSVDLDDDNDGILDTVECPLSYPVNDGTNTVTWNRYDLPALSSNSNSFYGNNEHRNNGGTNPSVSGDFPLHTGVPNETNENESGWVSHSDTRGQFATFEGYILLPCGASSIKLRAARNGGNFEVFTSLHLALEGVDVSRDASKLTNVSELVTTATGAFISQSEYELASHNSGEWARFGLAVSDGRSKFGASIEWSIDDGAWVSVPMSQVSNVASNPTSPGCCDTDGDGIPNSLDLDSDQDGCSDFSEAYSGTTLISGDIETTSTGTSWGDNGFEDNLETTADSGVPNTTAIATDNSSPATANSAAGYADAIDNNVKNCSQDTDGDSIPDDVDLDDDNDGILDTDENVCDNAITTEVFTNAELDLTDTGSSAPYRGNFAPNGWSIVSGSTDRDDFDQYYTTYVTGGRDYKIPPSTQGWSSMDTGLLVSIRNGKIDGTNTRDGTFERIQATITGLIPGKTYEYSFEAALNKYKDGNTTIDPELTYGTLEVEVDGVSAGAHNLVYGGAAQRYTFTWTQPLGGSSNAVIELFSGSGTDVTDDTSQNPMFLVLGGSGVFNLAECELDTDMDGIPDYQDLDSDGDGCPDALEANAALDYSDLNADGSINATAGSVTDTNPGVPNNTPSADIGTSQDASQQAAECDACNSASSLFVDSDGDGIGDECDLDDDNDGILDEVENACGQSGSWTTSSSSASGTSGDVGINITSVETSGGNTQMVYISDDNLNTNNSWSNPNVAGDTSLDFLLFWDTSSEDSKDEASNDAGVRNVTITFDKPLSRVILHLDKLGGSGGDDATGYISNSAEWTLTNSDISMTRLSGNSPFIVSGDKFYRLPNQSVSQAGETNATSPELGTAAGSIEFNSLSPISSLTFSVTGIGVEGGGVDGVEFLFETCELVDTDGDGIPNKLDTDSDNDGCPDAIEAAGSFTAADLTSSNNLADADEGTVNNNGIPVPPGAAGDGTTGQATTSAVTEAFSISVSGVDDQTVFPGDTVTFTATPAGIITNEYSTDGVGTPNYTLPSPGTEVTSGYTYQWFLNGTEISGATNATYEITNVQASNNEDEYSVAVSHTDMSCPVEDSAILTIDTTCSISSSGIVNQMCNNNGSDTDPSDDYITFSLSPVAVNAGTTYTVSASNGGSVTLAGGGVAQGSFGSSTDFRLQNGSADASTVYTLTITSDDDQMCTRTETLVVQVTCSSAINPMDDEITISASEGSSGITLTDPALNVLANDEINGVLVDPNAVTITALTTGPLSVDANGVVSVASGTASGTYTLEYEVCENGASPANCSTATVTVTVSAADPIEAVSDDYSGTPIDSSVDDVVVGDVTANDMLNGVLVSDSDINITVTDDGGVIGVMIDSDGNLTVPSGTAPGNYIVTYTICETAVPTNCDTTTVSIFVGACLDFPTYDCDGDGETNAEELANGNDPEDPCSVRVVTAQTNPMSPGTAAQAAYDIWAAADCDGDGDPNGTDSGPNDPCVSSAGSTPDMTNAVWQSADCDGDGETNGVEAVNGTDPTDPCSVTNATIPVNPGMPGTSVQTAYDMWSSADCDGDGESNGLEAANGTDPTDPCSVTTATVPVNPMSPDTAEQVAYDIWASADCDGDGESNGVEATNGTDSNDPCSNSGSGTVDQTNVVWQAADCDGDGESNGVEVTNGTDPNNPCSNSGTGTVDTSNAEWQASDCDGDGESNGLEATNGTDPSDPCSNSGTGTADITNAVWQSADCDGDGETNGLEATNGTDPTDPCSVTTASIPVNPGMPGTASQAAYDLWASADCDGDGESNGFEVINGTDPTNPCGVTTATTQVDPMSPGTAEQAAYDVWAASDCDGDGVSAGQEVLDGSDPNNSCSYTLSSITEPITSGVDCDGDGLTDAEEITGVDDISTPGDPNGNLTDPSDPDSDGDGVSDGQEAIDETDPNDSCSLVLASQSLTPDAAWQSGDCDGDGNSNSSDPNVLTAVATDDYTHADVEVPHTINIVANDDFLIGSTITVLSTGSASGTISVDSATGELTYTAPVSEDNMVVTIDYQVCNGSVCATATVHITIPICEDTDGDNICDVDDTAPNDPCSPSDHPDFMPVGTSDCDNDGLTYAEETTGIDDLSTEGNPGGAITNPNDIDSDGDGVSDGQEAIDGTNPNDPCSYEVASITEVIDSGADCDNDGLLDVEEITGVDDPSTMANPNGNETDPANPDTDGDGVSDGQEAIDGTDPNDPCSNNGTGIPDTSNVIWQAADCDGDGETNSEETSNGTDPNDPCDYTIGSTPDTSNTVWQSADCDGDGETNSEELANGTDLNDPCSNSGTGTADITNAVWQASDCDGDGESNGVEASNGTDPTDPCSVTIVSIPVNPGMPGTTAQAAYDLWSSADCDGDGETNGVEAANGTDSNDPCSNSGSGTVDQTNAVWQAADCDGDGETNGVEASNGTDSNDPCSNSGSGTVDQTNVVWQAADCDGDGESNGVEATNGTDPNNPCSNSGTGTVDTNNPLWQTADCDGDGETNGVEASNGTDPNDPCSNSGTGTVDESNTVWQAADCDGDGESNGVEVANGTDSNDPCSNGGTGSVDESNAIWQAADCDGDGESNGLEVSNGTDPNDPCSVTTATVPVNPMSPGTAAQAAYDNWSSADCDGDGESNGVEATNGTDSNDPCSNSGSGTVDQTNVVWQAADCDGDGESNGVEVTNGTDPNNPCSNSGSSTVDTSNAEWQASDCDGDGESNGVEVTNGTDPNDPCSNSGTGTADITNAVWQSADCDGDGETNGLEVTNGTDPTDPCSVTTSSIPVNPGMPGTAAQTAYDVWSSADCDGDVEANGLEVINGTDPTDPCSVTTATTQVDPMSPGTAEQTAYDVWAASDCDGDGVSAGQEVLDGSDPNDSCSYTLASITETITSGVDCDGDGLTDAEEITGVDDISTPGDPNGHLTDPSDPDSDGDGVSDGQEALDETDPNDSCSLILASQSLTPDAAWQAADCDGDGNSNSSDPNVLTAVATDDYTHADIEIPHTINIVANDDFLVGSTITVLSTGSASGTISVDSVTGELTYTALASEDNMTVTVDYQVCNGSVCATATVHIIIPICVDTDGDNICDEDDSDPTDWCSPSDHPDFIPVAESDCDNDGLTYAEETTGIDDLSTDGNPDGAITNPNDPDTDGDGVSDGQEAIDGTNPNDPCSYEVASITSTIDSGADCDNDGLLDVEEITGVDDPSTMANPNGNETDPANPDTDGDGVSDGQEAIDGTDPNNPCEYESTSQTLPTSISWNTIDCDGDGDTNGEEVSNNTDPNDPCSNSGTGTVDTNNPLWQTADCDGDGTPNGIDTNPTDPCEGGDVANVDLSDTMSTWYTADCDGDGQSNGSEIDPDGNGVDDGNGTSPSDPCEGGNLSNVDLSNTTSDWYIADCDGDGVTNGTEVDPDGNGDNDANGTDPDDPCELNTEDITETQGGDWLLVDCDGDGTPNGMDDDPTDPCEGGDIANVDLSDTTSTWYIADCDGDGQSNGSELDPDGNGIDDGNGTSPTNPCEGGNLSDVDLTDTTSDWYTADCDGDGVINGTEVDPDGNGVNDANGTDPTDPCEGGDLDAVDLSDTTSAWYTADCDGDGVINGTEVDPDGNGVDDGNGTDSTDPCELNVADVTVTQGGDWLAADCDGDGTPNGEDSDPTDPCEGGNLSNVDLTDITSAWYTSDCDGDGVINGTEVDPDGNGENEGNGTDPEDPCEGGDLDAVDLNDTTSDWYTADCDGDGVINGTEVDPDGNGIDDGNGTDPTDPCELNAADITEGQGGDWLLADCDGDGTPNGMDSNPTDSCEGGNLASVDLIDMTSDWYTADCDGDGVINGTELDPDGDGVLGPNGTDPTDPCSLNLEDITEEQSGAWESADCDGDGTPNGVDTNPTDPCEGGDVTNVDLSDMTSTWYTADCDGDGQSNGSEMDPDGNGVDDGNGTDPTDPCEGGNLASVDLSDMMSDWYIADCDGDGVINGTEVDPNGNGVAGPNGTDPTDPCEFNVADVTETQGGDWLAADCDGDGTPNGVDTNPTDPCEGGDVTNVDLTDTTSAWYIADCDGDGQSNGSEMDPDGNGVDDGNGTDPNDPCEGGNLASVDLSDMTSAWYIADCDGDGVINGTEVDPNGNGVAGPNGTDPNDPCEFNVEDITESESVDWLAGDCDGDGVTNGQEITDGTDPTDLCDFLTGSQTLETSSAWNAADCDGDGVTNGQEVTDGTDSNNPCDGIGGTADTSNIVWQSADCDGDGETNGQEIENGTNPNDPCSNSGTGTIDMTNTVWQLADCDGDGVTNGQELTDGTDPNNPCDGIGGTADTSNIVWQSADCDGDGESNGQEAENGTNPNDPCSNSGAGTIDMTNTLWLSADCDGDGESNGQEIENGTDPNDPCSNSGTGTADTSNIVWQSTDCDGDGESNGQEIENGTNPNNPCSNSGTGTVDTTHPVWQSSDCDRDGVTNGQEVIDGTDPEDPCNLVLESQTETPNEEWNNADCDGGGITNGQEISNGTNPFDASDDSEVEVNNVITPNNDGDNDVLILDGLQHHSDNTVQIYNRWGVLVYDVIGYNNEDRAFRGYSDGRTTVVKSEELPVGTYFYVLKFQHSTTGEDIMTSGYLYIQR